MFKSILLASFSTHLIQQFTPPFFDHLLPWPSMITTLLTVFLPCWLLVNLLEVSLHLLISSIAVPQDTALGLFSGHLYFFADLVPSQAFMLRHACFGPQLRPLLQTLDSFSPTCPHECLINISVLSCSKLSAWSLSLLNLLLLHLSGWVETILSVAQAKLRCRSWLLSFSSYPIPNLPTHLMAVLSGYI